MANDLSNKEQILYDFMKSMLRKDFPDLDLSDNGAFMEMFGLPSVKLLNPLVDFADRVTLMQSLENAEFMTEEEMNKVASKQYVYREPGDTSKGDVMMIFTDIPKTGTLVVPAGFEVLSQQGYRYRSSRTVTMTENQLVNFYDPETFRYRIPVSFESVDLGKMYDVREGEINKIATEIPFLEKVINEMSFSGGRDSETNLELAQRIKESIGAPNLGNNRGFIRFVKSFKDVEDLIVAGYGHPLMKRDIIGTIKTNDGAFTQTVRDVHWGTKVDIYIRGQRLKEVTEYFDVIPTKEENKFKVKLNRTPVHDIIDVKHYSDFGQLDDPSIDQSQLYITNYAIEKDENPETIGTLDEVSWLILTDETLSENSNVQVRYRFNELIEEINNKMYQEDERPPTGDILLKEANKKQVFGSLIVRMKTPIGVREKDKSYIRQRVFDLIDNIKMGEEIQFSDIPSYLTQFGDEAGTYELESIVDYVNLPYQFIVTENMNKHIFYCMSQKQRDLINSFKIEKPFLYDIFEKYKDYITVYDFFDVMHAFTYDNGLENALSEIEFLDYEWGRKVETFRQVREMIVKGMVTKRLSPARSTTGENEFFELGDLFIYEDKEYQTNDWKSSITLIKNLASLGENSEDENTDFFHIAAYCMTIVYILSANKSLEINRDPLYQYLLNVADNTPIRHELNR